MPHPSDRSPSRRLDQLLAERGLFGSREKAKRAILAGVVRVDGRVVDKPGTAVGSEVSIEIATPDPFVSRGGNKLAGALDELGVDPGGLICLDVGASTGGFTDCLLKRGAIRVYAIDVGYGQLDYGLRQDPRVVVMERTNARYLGREDLPEPIDLVTVDVSFISVLKVVPALIGHVRPGGRLLVLVKPQFEAGRRDVGKGGIVRDEAVRRRVIERRAEELVALGLDLRGLVESVLPGAGGNREAFCLLARPQLAAGEAERAG